MRLENSELQKQRLTDSERHQQLRDDHQLLKHENSELQKEITRRVESDQVLKIKLNSLEEERVKLIKDHDQLREGVATLFEFIRRNKAKDDVGNVIPNLRVHPNAFRQ